MGNDSAGQDKAEVIDPLERREEAEMENEGKKEGRISQRI